MKNMNADMVWIVQYDYCELIAFNSKEKAYNFIVDYIQANFDEDDNVELLLDMLEEDYELHDDEFGCGDEIVAYKLEVH